MLQSLYQATRSGVGTVQSDSERYSIWILCSYCHYDNTWIRFDAVHCQAETYNFRNKAHRLIVQQGRLQFCLVHPKCTLWHSNFQPTSKALLCRYEAFKTIGEKKACFNEYLQQRAKEEKEESRSKAKQIRDAFFTLLELSPELKTGTRYSKAAAMFDDEPRWKASSISNHYL